MAIISASAMIRGLSLFHVTLAALLLRNPAILSNQSIVLLLGESMQLVSFEQVHGCHYNSIDTRSLLHAISTNPPLQQHSSPSFSRFSDCQT